MCASAPRDDCDPCRLFLIKGRSTKFDKIKDSEEKGIVIIHQELALIPYMTIGENMFLGNERGHSTNQLE